MELIFAVALVAALVAVAVRRRRGSGGAAGPGSTHENPIRVDDFREMDAALERARCPCGGRWQRRGETPGPRGSALRGARRLCTACEREDILWFSVGD